MKTTEQLDKIKDTVGTYVYRIKDNKIQKSMIEYGRITIQLNTGSDTHGKFLDPVIEYRFNQEKEWTNERDIYLTKEDLVNTHTYDK